jgi:hypothetical protein
MISPRRQSAWPRFIWAMAVRSHGDFGHAQYEDNGGLMLKEDDV